MRNRTRDTNIQTWRREHPELIAKIHESQNPIADFREMFAVEYSRSPVTLDTDKQHHTMDAIDRAIVETFDRAVLPQEAHHQFNHLLVLLEKLEDGRKYDVQLVIHWSYVAMYYCERSSNLFLSVIPQ